DIRLDARSDTDKPRPNTQPQMVPPFSGYSQAPPVPAIPPPGTFPPPHPSFGYPMQPPAPFTAFAPPVRRPWTPDCPRMTPVDTLQQQPVPTPHFSGSPGPPAPDPSTTIPGEFPRRILRSSRTVLTLLASAPSIPPSPAPPTSSPC